MEQQLKHFTHDHLLSLVQLQPEHNNDDSDKEDHEDKDEDDFVVEEPLVGKCNMCEEEIYSFHLCYYTCKECHYSLHTFCAQLPQTQQNHPLHPGHNLELSSSRMWDWYARDWRCATCQVKRNSFWGYHCSICRFSIDIICAGISEQKMDHPSHPHQLQRYFRPMISQCNACGDEHSGTFYHCTTCFRFNIHLSCALLPDKLQIQHTNESFSHPHSLTLAYSFPYIERVAKFYPKCRVCEKDFGPNMRYDYSYLWHYRCDKCRYYVHVDCATSRKEAFMSSILMPAGMGKTYKNFTNEDHPNLIRCPFPDESVNLLKHLFNNKGELVMKEKIAGEMFSHPHPLILVDTLLNGSVSLHDDEFQSDDMMLKCIQCKSAVHYNGECETRLIEGSASSTSEGASSSTSEGETEGASSSTTEIETVI